MRNIWLVVGAATLVGIFSACGGNGDHAAVPDEPTMSTSGKGGGGTKSTTSGGTSTGGKSTGGKSSGGSDSLGGAGGTTDNDAITVKITSPDEAPSPDDGVLAESSVHVVCSAQSEPDAAAAGQLAVKLAIKNAKGKVIEEKVASGSKTDDEYSADFVLTGVPSGKIFFTCSATDPNQGTATDTISSFVDHGPTITVVKPVADSAHPLKGGLAVEFSVKPTPLADDDSGADVDTVVFSLDGKEMPVKEVSAGRFQTTLALDDTEKFPVPPRGAIAISASNKRSPTPVTATESYNTVIDGEGPTIAITAPLPQAVVGGKITLKFTVNDKGSGVDEKAVNVALFSGDDPRFFDPNKGWSHDGANYVFTFDSKDIEPDAPVQTTINVRASDLVGNLSASGQSLQLYFDNVPPQIDIDPRNIRMESGSSCSGSFDPVGSAVVNDLDGQFGSSIVNPIAWFRVLVEERTNSQPGQSIFYFSGTDQEQVRLYVQPDAEHATTKLLVNKNPGTDTTCDDIGGIDDIDNPPPFTALHPINADGPVGTPWNRDDDKDVEPAASADCNLTDGAPPLALCPAHNSDLWWVPFNQELHEPYIYVVGTPDPNAVSCAGIDLVYVNSNQKDGWACAAARVVDHAGNVGVSPPIRICVDDGKGAPPPCRVSSTIPPTCTDGCTPPQRGGGVAFRGQ